MIYKKKRDVHLIVIGLDGASWNVLFPLIEKGDLPTFKRLLEDGIYAYLESIKPPISVPAWKCYSTGRTPGNLGVYTFLVFDFKNRTYRVAQPKDFNGLDLWDYLGTYNYVSCVYKMFSTHPARKINGCMISDFPLNSAGFSPPELQSELSKRFGSLWFDIAFTTNRVATYHKVLVETKKDFEILKYLITKYSPHFVHISIAHTDGIQHFFWGDMLDEKSPYKDYIRNAWKKVDSYLADFLEFLSNRYDNNFYLFIISDHGFTHVKYRFNIGRWLLKKGYLRLTFIGKLYSLPFLLKFINYDTFYIFVELLIKIARKLRSKKVRWGVQFNLTTNLLEKIIDFDRSLVIPLEGQLLYVNEKLFKDEKLRNSFVTRLMNELKAIKTPDGEDIAIEIFDGKEYYKVSSAPDIIIVPNSVNLYNAPLLRTLWSRPPKNKWTGMHSLYGILIARGPGIKKGAKISNARIIDVAPTILHIFGIPLPKGIDGNVLKDIFEENSYLAKKLVTYSESMCEKNTYKLKVKLKIRSLKAKGKL